MDEGLANGTILRLLPSQSWSGNDRGDVQGVCGDHGKWKLRQLSLLKDNDFEILVSKDDNRRVEEAIHVVSEDIFNLGEAKEETKDAAGLGTVHVIPARLAYAITARKGQGLTIDAVYALLEGLFAHGQVYEQTFRTPLEE